MYGQEQQFKETLKLEPGDPTLKNVQISRFDTFSAKTKAFLKAALDRENSISTPAEAIKSIKAGFGKGASWNQQMGSFMTFPGLGLVGANGGVMIYKFLTEGYLEKVEMPIENKDIEGDLKEFKPEAVDLDAELASAKHDLKMSNEMMNNATTSQGIDEAFKMNQQALKRKQLAEEAIEARSYKENLEEFTPTDEELNNANTRMNNAIIETANAKNQLDYWSTHDPQQMIDNGVPDPEGDLHLLANLNKMNPGYLQNMLQNNYNDKAAAEKEVTDEYNELRYTKYEQIVRAATYQAKETDLSNELFVQQYANDIPNDTDNNSNN